MGKLCCKTPHDDKGSLSVEFVHIHKKARRAGFCRGKSEAMEKQIKRYSVAQMEPGVAAHLKSVAEKFNLDTGLKGYVSKVDVTEKVYEIRADYAAEAYKRIEESIMYIQPGTEIESFVCFGFPFLRRRKSKYRQFSYLCLD
ncbi:hypothetical protein BDC45DRAFT_536181 [Circinella umbellata]|nr:hypothetical protein BDC45DRAFT_536181 [Circinella umbellata]